MDEINKLLLMIVGFVLLSGTLFFINTYVYKKHKNLWNILSIVMFSIATICAINMFFFIKGLIDLGATIMNPYLLICGVSFIMFVASLVVVFKNNMNIKALIKTKPN